MKVITDRRKSLTKAEIRGFTTRPGRNLSYLYKASLNLNTLWAGRESQDPPIDGVSGGVTVRIDQITGQRGVRYTA